MMIILLCVFSMLSSVLSIDIDYYLGIMRSADCYGQNKNYCRRFCNGGPSICHTGECYCHYQTFNKGKNIYGKIISRSKDEEYDYSDVNPAPDLRSVYALEIEDFNDNSDESLPSDEEIDQRPALRHHIAHFCPNLDVARKCIAQCIQLGKPAFCGKDHVCHCGHSYDPAHEKDEPVESKAKYVQFKDMYQKYYGQPPVKERGRVVEGNIPNYSQEE